ncbi:MAG: VanZ family protein [Bacteroidota bacterium]
MKNKLTTILFIIYLIFLTWIVVFKLNVSFSYMKNTRSVNLVPFSKPLILNGKVDFGEMILNIIIFVPFGIYAGVLFKRWRVGKKVLLFVLASLTCEGCQFISGTGAFDITDIITNTSGGLIGLMIFKGIEINFKTSVKAQLFINIIAAIGTIVAIVFLLLLKTNNLWLFGKNIRYQ